MRHRWRPSENVQHRMYQTRGGTERWIDMIGGLGGGTVVGLSRRERVRVEYMMWRLGVDSSA